MRQFSKYIYSLSGVLLLFTFLSVNTEAREKISGRGPVRLSKTSIFSTPFFEANRIRTYVTNEGELVSFRISGNAGMFWPKGTNKTINFQSGIWIAGKVDGIIRTAAAEYVTEFVPGTGGPEGKWRDATFNKHFRNYDIRIDDVRGQPGIDYLEWPFEDGAPSLLDENGNPILDDSGNLQPGLMGDQTLWAVFNDEDRDRHLPLFSTNPLGVEVQQTVWGYNRADAFGDMMFMKYIVINKGADSLKESYLSFWADVDLGDSNDDLVALVLEESFGYHYNDGSDPIYGDNPPAIGYDFFQGPFVFVPCAAGDTPANCRANGGSFFDNDGDGEFNLSMGDTPVDTAKVSRHFRSSGRIIGATNLRMSSFAHYVRGGDPWERDPETAIEVYNFMQGLDGLGNTKLDDDGNPTLFSYTGDPVANSGWLRDAGADMRFLMTAGPFTIAPGDTQELVGGIVIAQGANRLDAVTQVKAADLSAQIAYDIDFALPPPPPPPIVTVGSVENGIILTWEPNAESYDQEDPTVRDSLAIPIRYKFQGYNIYQFNGPTVAEGFESKLLATFDIIDGVTKIMGQLTVNGTDVEVVVQTGLDNGIQRTLFLTEDAIRGGDLVNFRKYYFGVESYGYHEIGSPRFYPSPPLITTAIPGPPVAGTVLSYEAGQEINTFERISSVPNEGLADIDFTLTVVDPNQTVNNTYNVSFFTDSLNTDYWWRLTDASTSEVLVDSQATSKTTSSITEALLVNPLQINIVDGFSLSLQGTYLPPSDTLNDGTTKQTENIDPTTTLNFKGTSKLGLAPATKPTGLLKDFFRGVGGDQPLVFRRDVEIRFTEGGSKAWMYHSAVNGMVINKDSSKQVDVPYEVWDTEYDNGDGILPGRQINSIFVDDQKDKDLTNGFLGVLDPITRYNGDWDFIIPVYSSYSPMQQVTSTDSMSGWVFVFAQDSAIEVVSASGLDTTYINAGWSVGDVFHATFKNQIEVDEDILTFTTKAPETGNEDAINSEISKINVFPNPYFGQNIEEINAFNRFVTFTHLPPTDVTIRVFTLAGHLVSVINHSNGTSMEQWNLNNNDGIPIASGMYIAHIETSTGKSKILKFAVMIPEERIGLF